jgi:hypothetical protein
MAAIHKGSSDSHNIIAHSVLYVEKQYDELIEKLQKNLKEMEKELENIKGFKELYDKYSWTVDGKSISEIFIIAEDLVKQLKLTIEIVLPKEYTFENKINLKLVEEYNIIKTNEDICIQNYKNAPKFSGEVCTLTSEGRRKLKAIQFCPTSSIIGQEFPDNADDLHGMLKKCLKVDGNKNIIFIIVVVVVVVFMIISFKT